MYDFLLGVTATGCLVIALFFLKFWRSSGNRFFALMAAGFGIFAVNRVVLSQLSETSEARPLVYVLRLAAFAIIIAAVVLENRRAEPDEPAGA